MNTFYDNFAMKTVLKNANIDDAATVSTYTDMAQRHRIAFVGEMDATPAAALLDVIKLVQATSSAGAGKKDIANAAIVDFTNVNIAGDQWILELDAIAMDFANSFQFAAVEIAADADNTDLNVSIFRVADVRYANELLNLNATDVLTNFKKVP